jgi:hypothetical protein
MLSVPFQSGRINFANLQNSFSWRIYDILIKSEENGLLSVEAFQVNIFTIQVVVGKKTFQNNTDHSV